ncbi:MAG: thioredoxin domain-containing protein [Candidatus Buchananbacteria bacterium]|nr:thioredoxin domain-containing protein [Candidatus Buchananbacteria bacterium]
MFTRPLETKSDPLADALKNFNPQSNIESSNLISYVKKNIITEPTVNPDSPVLGPADAPVTIFEFSCYGCPASRDIQPILKEVLAKYPDKVKLVWKDLTLPDLYPQAELAHLASRCAQEQSKFWPYQEQLWQNQNDFSLNNLKKIGQDIGLNASTLNDCITSKKFQNLIDADVSEAAQLMISGTPHFYINSQEIFGLATLEDFETVINAELNR